MLFFYPRLRGQNRLFLSIFCAICAYIVVNKPPEPVLLTSIRLSQTKTYQTIGENLDLRGLYLDCEYSDGTKKTISASTDMITRTSNNINNNFKIIGLLNSNKQAFVYFGMDGQEVKLDIDLSQIEVSSVAVNIFSGNVAGGDKILFENILLLGNAKIDGVTETKIKLDSKSAIYSVKGTPSVSNH